METMHSNSPASYPVAIVGGGPTGLSASILLSQCNIPHVLFERYPSTSIHPKACGYNHRTVEIWRRMGVEDELIKRRAPADIICRTGWYTSFGPSGKEIVSRDSWGGGAYEEEYASVSPCQYSILPQIRLEPILQKRALELNPRGILYNTEVTKVEEVDDHVLITYQRKGQPSETMRAKYCICADGGRGLTEQLGIGWEGERDVMNMVSAHIRAPLSLHHPDIRNFITWFVNPKLGGTIGSGYLYHLGPYPISPDTEEWVFACGLPPGERSMDGPAILNRMHITLQIPDLKADVLSTSYWYVNALTARRYRSKRSTGRVFVVGDAAHRIPPWGALGLNTGVQDVDNLVWKLNLAVNGVPSSLEPGADLNALLDTYDSERRPIGQRVRDNALRNLRSHGLVMDRAIGVSPSNTRDENVANMDSFLNAPADDREAITRREAVDRAQKTLDAEFHALGAEVGWFYPDVDVDGEGKATNHDGQLTEDGQLDSLYFHPSTIPGHHLPHAWLEQDGRRLSTRDLVRYDGFALFTSRPGLWSKAVEDDGHGLVRLVAVLDKDMGSSDHQSSGWKDVDGKWATERGIGSSGAVLVRPDGIVVWRAKEFDQDKHSARGWLSTVLRRALKLA
ncbi:aromatic ring hydroxylase [Cladophialophora carrionii]|uniref:Aromatic ring hydroxylase n=1 Tax=Cladophialophora carrionii TaxID=86049 RepID=A0A1C1CMG0_9EURO|nr:aromatic ring hydroxylase [Cladophialophora carrionii]